MEPSLRWNTPGGNALRNTEEVHDLKGRAFWEGKSVRVGRRRAEAPGERRRVSFLARGEGVDRGDGDTEVIYLFFVFFFIFL